MKDTKDLILTHATHLTAVEGCHALSMRELAGQIPITQSVLYHYFADKEALLTAMYVRANTQLGEARALLPALATTQARLEQLVRFQLQHAEHIVAVLRYYLYKREDFHQKESGTLPEKATLHVEEVLAYGLAQKEIETRGMRVDSKVISHAINGYLLEYYPHMPTGKAEDELVDALVSFSLRALKLSSKK